MDAKPEEKQYFVEIEGKQKGPYKIDQLLSLQITEHTMIWTSGLENWVKAGQLDELSALLIKIPPTTSTKKAQF